MDGSDELCEIATGERNLLRIVVTEKNGKARGELVVLVEEHGAHQLLNRGHLPLVASLHCRRARCAVALASSNRPSAR